MKFDLRLITVVCALTLLSIPFQQAQARTKIECRFDWDDNEALNVKGSQMGIIRSKKVRTSEYNRLVQMGTVPARVSADRGGKCTLYHPENRIISHDVNKDRQRLNLTGSIPNCADLNATVTCAGEIGPRSSRLRTKKSATLNVRPATPPPPK